MDAPHISRKLWQAKKVFSSLFSHNVEKTQGESLQTLDFDVMAPEDGQSKLHLQFQA